MFRPPNQFITKETPTAVDFSGNIFSDTYYFRDGLQPEMEFHFRSVFASEAESLDFHRDSFPHIVGGHKRPNMPKAAAPREGPHLSAKQSNRTCAACRCPAIHPRGPHKHHHERMGSDCDAVDYKSLACHSLPDVAMSSNHNLSRRGRG